MVMTDGDFFDDFGSFSNLVGVSELPDIETVPGDLTLDDIEEQSASENCTDDQIDQSFQLVGSEHGTGVLDEALDQPSSSASTQFDIDKSVRMALQDQRVELPKQVWEVGVWSHIFSNSSFEETFNLFGQELHRPTSVAKPLPAETSVEALNKKAKTTESFQQVVRFKPDISWKEQVDAALQSSVKLWYLLIQRWKVDCAMYIETHEFRMETDALTMLLDIFAGRSPYTLRKRALAVMRICDFLETNYRPSFPIPESTMYLFLCCEREAGAPVSRLKGYMQAINFCRYVFDMTELEETVNSARCKGSTRQKHVVERRQASPLLVKEVSKLHDVLEHGTEQWNRLFAGAALFCLYSRARWGDLMRAETVLIDCDSSGVACYLEARVGSHKTMQSQQHRHQFLPMVAPREGVRSGNWIEQWMRVRKVFSLDFDSNGVMPAPQADGSPGVRPLDSQEAAAWLRMILFGCSDVSPDRKVASHSLKATTLSYAAKRGLDITLRMQLGYHTQPYRMGLTYSRDGAAASLLALEQLLSEIRCGIFLPDETRSGRILKSGNGLGQVVIDIKDEADREVEVHPKSVVCSQPFPPDPPIEVVDAALEDAGVLSSGSESTSGSEMEETSYRPEPGAGRFKAPEAPLGFHMWQHRKSRIIHLMSNNNLHTFSCGRSAGPLHQKDGLHPRYDTPICWACFNKAKQ